MTKKNRVFTQTEKNVFQYKPTFMVVFAIVIIISGISGVLTTFP